MTKHLAIIVLFIIVAFAAGAADETVTLTGEIVDLHCYTTRGAHGPEHAGCSNACISRDVPVGLLTADGTLYLLLDEKPIAVKEKVAGLAGKTVKATGKIVERSGFKALQLASVAVQ
ncbi:MAG TPA: hypothetical protein VGQ76_14735 [Thermoanaerobaculia bacterium]|jgi:hypothetical protein|nr:hypothetical protein [Thermoanaerobaculia bacterium]